MENTTEEIKLNMETDSNINQITNTQNNTPQTKKHRGRPKKQEEATTTTKKAREPKTNNINKLDDEQKQLLNLQAKLNKFKEAEKEYKEALKQFKPTPRPKRKPKKEDTTEATETTQDVL